MEKCFICNNENLRPNEKLLFISTKIAICNWCLIAWFMSFGWKIEKEDLEFIKENLTK